MKQWKRLILASLFVLLLGGVAWQFIGCVSDQKLAETREAAVNARAVAVAEADKAEAAGDTERAAKLRALVANIDKGLLLINADGTINVPGAVGLLPPPFDALAMIGLPLIAGLAGEIRRKRAVEDLAATVKAVEIPKADPVVAAAFDAKTPEINKAMGPRAAARVRKLRKKTA